MIRQFHLSEDNGLSIKDIALEIGPAYSKIRAELGAMVTREERENLKKEIDQQTEKINEYIRSVDIIKLENLEIFKKIEDILKSLQTAQGHQTLTINSSLSEVNTFLRNFSTYIQSGNGKLDQLPDGIIVEVVQTNVDRFWMTMLEGWGFCEKKTSYKNLLT